MEPSTTRAILDQLAELHAIVQEQGRDLARHRRRERGQRVAHRLRPVILAALLVALVPLATLAAGPFSDLNPGSPHNTNIDLIFDAGITTGCDPGVAYCPNGNVTREEMASFLARTAGLGNNPPLVNAATAVNATTAQSAAQAQEAAALGGQPPSYYQPAGQPIANAINAQNAASAATAQQAANAATVGGYAPGDLGRVAFSATRRNSTLPVPAVVEIAQVTLTIPGDRPQAVAVRGLFNAYGQLEGGFIVAALRQDDGAFEGALYAPYRTTDLNAGIAAAAQWVFVAPPGTHTYTLVAQAFGTAGTLLVGETPTLIATTHPFGPEGLPAAP